jgi:hypothetical protein
MTTTQFVHACILRLVIICLVWAALAFFTVNAGDWSFGLTTHSYHPHKRTFECDGVQNAYNETNPGIFVRYKYLLAGRYENSMSGCKGAKWSSFIGIEKDLGNTGPVIWSVTAAIADGYPEFRFPNERYDLGEYKVGGSVNARVGFFKIYYGYKVVVMAVEFGSWNNLR